MGDTFEHFRLNRAAFRYFGIICFEDMPGYYPQLEIQIEQQNINLKHHVGKVLDVIDAQRK